MKSSAESSRMLFLLFLINSSCLCIPFTSKTQFFFSSIFHFKLVPIGELQSNLQICFKVGRMFTTLYPPFPNIFQKKQKYAFFLVKLHLQEKEKRKFQSSKLLFLVRLKTGKKIICWTCLSHFLHFGLRTCTTKKSI